ncbi:hypothetical protein [Streptomyces sp. KR80]
MNNQRRRIIPGMDEGPPHKAAGPHGQPGHSAVLEATAADDPHGA